MTESSQVKFGFGQITNPTPSWAKWAFRVFFYVTSLATVIITMTGDIPDSIALEITKWVSIANMAVHGLSKMFGIDISDSDINYFDKSKK